MSLPPVPGEGFVPLFEGLDARRDDGLGAEVGVVLLAEWLVAFAVPHFAEDAAAGARDAFDGVQDAGADFFAGAVAIRADKQWRTEDAQAWVAERGDSFLQRAFHARIKEG